MLLSPSNSRGKNQLCFSFAGKKILPKHTGQQHLKIHTDQEQRKQAQRSGGGGKGVVHEWTQWPRDTGLQDFSSNNVSPLLTSLALQVGLSSSGLEPSGACPVLSKLSCPGQDRAEQGQPRQSHRWVQVSGSARVGASLEDDDSDPAVLELLQLNRPEMALLPWLLTTAALPIVPTPDVWYTFQPQPKHQGRLPTNRARISASPRPQRRG